MEYKGFLSYVRITNEQDSGKIIDFCKSVELELRIKSINFKFLNDQHDIQWGENWREFVNVAPSNCDLFIPIIVESYFDSDNCTREYHSFRLKESAIGTRKAILPIYYDDCTPAQEGGSFLRDEIKRDVFGRQYLDWIKIRHEPIGSKARNIAISDAGAKIAQIIRGWEKSGLKTSFAGSGDINTFNDAEESLSPINTTRALNWIQNTDDEESKNIIMRLFDQPVTQQRIIKLIYTRMQSNESLIADEVYKRCLLAGVIKGECTSSEFIYRLRDLYHSKLIFLHVVGTKTTTISQIPEVRFAISSSGISNS